MGRIRLQYLMDRLEVGGAERVLEMACAMLPRDRFDIRVDCLFSGGRIAGRIRNLGIAVEVLGARNLSDVSGFFKLYKRMKEWAPHILHTQLFPANFMGRIAGFLAGTPVIIATEQNIYRYKGLRHRLADRLLAYVSDRIIAVSHAVAMFTSRQEGIPLSKFAVLRNFSDVGRFKGALIHRLEARRRLSLSPETKLLVTVGSLSEQKGHPFLLEVFRELMGQVPNLQLLVVGEGPLRKLLELRIQELNLSGPVKLLGVREDVPEILSAADIFVFPSGWEGFSVALVEAMAAGLPIVASRLDEIAEAVRDGEEGFLMPAGDRQAWVSAILEILQNPERAKRLGEKARERSADFSAESGVKGWRNLYEELLRGKGVIAQ